MNKPCKDVLDSQPEELRQAALFWLAEPVVAHKLNGVARLAQAWSIGSVRLDAHAVLSPQSPLPGQPAKPEQVMPRLVKRRSMMTTEGRAILIHALAHIEFNAINLALDAVYRFRDMPEQYYTDWLNIAVEEALHFSLLEGYLKSKNSFYGAYDSHNGLWEMAVKTDDDVMVRMALVPRVLEARGLDVTPGMIAKFQYLGETELVDILNIIQRDEIGHVERGNYWFNELCRQRSFSSSETFHKLLDEYMEESMFDSLNQEARLQAGFSKQELIDLAARNRHTK